MSSSNSPKLSHTLVPVVLVAISAPLADFVFSSHTNPRFWDIVLSSIGLSLFVGVSASVVFLFVSRWSEGKTLRPSARGIAVLSFLLFSLCLGAALSILAANRPAKVQADLPVTYAFSCRSKLPPDTIQFESSEGYAAYLSMNSILRKFSEANAENARRVQGFSNLGLVNSNVNAITLLRDLSEYVILYWLSAPVVTQDISDVMYREGGGSWLAFPAASIRGARVFMASVEGEFKSNSFFGYRDILHPKENGLNLPTGMTVAVEHLGPWTSRIRLTNSYVKVTIGVEVASHRSGAVAILDDEQFPQPWLFGSSEYAQSIEAERRARYFIGQTVVHFDAEFDRLRYGFQKMRDHEAWVTDLQAFLERLFVWGAIDYARVTDVPLEQLASTRGCGN